MKKNRLKFIAIFLLLLIFTSCNSEDVSIINSYSVISNITEYDNVSVFKETFDKANITSSFKSLSYYMSFNNDNVEINSIKIINNYYHWDFNVEKLEINNQILFGKKGLILPNNNLIDNKFNLEVFLKDGRLLKKEIFLEDKNKPFDKQITFKNNQLFIVPNSTNVFTLDDSSVTYLNNLNENGSYLIRFYKDQEIIDEINFDCLSNQTYKISIPSQTSSIFIAKQINNYIVGNYYKLNSKKDSKI